MTSRSGDAGRMAEVARYFVGYPKPRVPRAPLAMLALAIVLWHPAATELAAAAFQPIKKLPHDVVQLSGPDTRVLRQPHPEYSHRNDCGGPPISRDHAERRRRLRDVVPTSPHRLAVIVSRHPRPYRLEDHRPFRPPAADTIERMQARGLHRLRAAFQLCVDLDGSVATVHRISSSGEQAWDDSLARTIRAWWYKSPEAYSSGQWEPGCTTLRFRFDL